MDPVRLGISFRALRHRRRWRQVDLADVAGCSRPAISRIERGRVRELSVGCLANVAAALEADLDVRLKWHGEELDRLIDAAHADLVERTVRLLRRFGWETRTEFTFNVRGERGSVDILAWRQAPRIVLVGEVKSRMADSQATNASLDRKTRLAPIYARELGWNAASVGRLLVLPEGRTARRHIAAHAATFASVLPVRGRDVGRWLRDPQPGARFGGPLFMADAHQASARRRVRVRPLGAASKPSTKRTARVGHEDRSPVPGSPKDRLTNI